MIILEDHAGRPQQCKMLVECASFQPLTKEVFWHIEAIGYDDVRRIVLFSFNSEKEMHEKYEELSKEYFELINKEMKEKIG